MRLFGPYLTTLSSLTIGSLTLTPAFDPDTTEYTAETTNATNKITAVATDSGDTVEILVGETEIESGESATWDEGENTVTITVSDRDDPENTTVYTVVVTAS